MMTDAAKHVFERICDALEVSEEELLDMIVGEHFRDMQKTIFEDEKEMSISKEVVDGEKRVLEKLRLLQKEVDALSSS